MSLENKTLYELKYKDQETHTNWWNHFVEGLHPNTIEIIEHLIKNYYAEEETPWLSRFLELINYLLFQ